MLESRIFKTSLTAVTLAVGCAKHTSDTEATSEAATTSATGTTADIAATSATETAANSVTSTASSGTTATSDTAPDSTSGASTSGDSSTGAPTMPCHLAHDEASCDAGEDCVFIPGLEMSVRDGECVPGELGEVGEVGFCYYMAGGGPDTPSFYYQVETGRVFAFLNSPEPPEGWVDCTCAPPSPETCQLCSDGCDGETSGE